MRVPPFGPLLLALAGCASTSPAVSVAAAGTALTTAEQLALVYVTKPQCPPSGGVDGVTCSQVSTVTTIKADALAAHNAYKAAEAVLAAGGNPDLTTLTAALAALQAAFPAAPAAPSS
jgi:hypothetical protein